MLVVSLVGGSPVLGEGCRRLSERTGVHGLLDEAGVVVLHLVVIPGEHPGESGVGCAQCRVALVLAVAIAVIGERDAAGECAI